MVEQRIVEDLAAAYPAFNIIGEESGDSGRDSEYCWIIDPMDGTHNFLHGHLHCAVSIALSYQQEPVVGVIYDPFRNELFTARKGAGAQLDNRRIRVSEITRLSDALLCTGQPYHAPEDTKPWLKSFAAVLPRAQSIHRTGSSVLDLAYLAAGRYDGFWEFGLRPWDIAAGALLVKEAGGLISDLRGGQNYMNSGDLVAGNPRIHEKLAQLVASK
jgi:myo-inositol-1(or 4)-monophosphatase